MSMRQTSLYSAQKLHGAIFGDFGEWLLPVHFGDPTHEHKAVRSNCGLLDRSARAKLVVAGSDRYSWLQGMVSNDVRLLETGAPSIDACILNATGHLLTDLTIVNRGDSLLLDMAWENRVKIFEFLDQFLITEDVEIVDQSEFLACLSVQGPTADAAQLAELAGQSVHLNTADHSGEGGVDLYVRADEAPALWQRLTDAGIPPIGEAAAETLRIEAGIPKYGVDMDATNIPLECGLESTHISHTKGCYIGQEIIARIQSRGHTNRALTGFLVHGDVLPTAGDEFSAPDGSGTKEAGWITSSVHSPTPERGICLGYLRHEFRDPGTKMRTVGGIALEVTTLPFVR